jgi:hypothetical protein
MDSDLTCQGRVRGAREFVKIRYHVAVRRGLAGDVIE